MNTLISNARLLTLVPDGDANPLGAIDCASVLIEGNRITHAGAGAPTTIPPNTSRIDANSRILMPAFTDAHTHACSAGDRLDEWEQKQRGATYLEILQSGGGIMSTVRAVRAASEQQLADECLARLYTMLAEGSTTIEVKSGYGLTTKDELKMLRAITSAAEQFPGTIVPTALIAHAIDPDQPGFIDTTIKETLPAVTAEFPGIAIDAYCEQGAWSFADTVGLFDAALEAGHTIRVHTDQFNELGMTRWCIDRANEGAPVRSVDHLEATSPEALRDLAASPLFAVMLPCSGFHVDQRYANARAYLDHNPKGGLVLASNNNPGSAPCGSIPFAIALANRFLGATPSEAITAVTRTPAALLGCSDRGTIELGKRADLILLRHTDERLLAYEFSGRHTDLVFAAGRQYTPDPLG
jgi:imidazolonepropionase